MALCSHGGIKYSSENKRSMCKSRAESHKHIEFETKKPDRRDYILYDLYESIHIKLKDR